MFRRVLESFSMGLPVCVLLCVSDSFQTLYQFFTVSVLYDEVIKSLFFLKKISKFISLRDENWAIFRDFQPTPCARSSWTLRLLFQAFVLNRRRSQEVSRVDEQLTKAAFLLANYRNHQFIVCFEALISACYSVRHRRHSRVCANLENKKHSAQLRIRTRYHRKHSETARSDYWGKF